MDPELLATFVAFAETRSFTRAAELRHLSQPAVHAQVRRLSERVGVALYRREGRELVLTPEGAELLSFATRHLAQADRFLASLRGELQEQPFVFAAGFGTWLHLLEPFVDWWRETSPGRLRPVVHGGPALVEALLEHRIDAGVTRWLAPVVGIEAVPWVQVGLAVMLPGGHRLADQRSVSLDDLADEALILPPEGRPHRVRVETAFAARGIRPRVEAEVDGWDLQRLFVSAGLGLAIVNDYCPAPEGGTARRLEGFDPLSWCFVHRSAGPAHPAAAEVRRWFEDG